MPDINPAVMEQKAGLAFQYAGGAFVSGVIYIGDKLGIYRAMKDAGPMTSTAVATKTGLNERFIREWLYQQTAAGILDRREGDQFELGLEAGLVFADETTPAALIGLFGELPTLMEILTGLAPKAFQTGLGATSDSFGELGAHFIDRFLGVWNRTMLVPEALPKIPGLVEKLTAGAKVADVGCGAGAGPIAIAAAFPTADVHAFDNSLNALKLAADNRAKAGVSNVQFHNSDHDPLPDQPTYDFMMTLDCLHDMARPDLAAAAIRKAIKPDGAWFIVDVDAGDTFEENLKNPLGPFFYAASIAMCLQSSASQTDGLQLGTVGLPESKMRALVEDAGFTSFERVLGLENPMNAFYVARP